jgi:hypothetical protein
MVERFDTDPLPNRPRLTKTGKSIRQKITFTDDKFDIKSLPIDMQRVVGHLTENFGEDYALTFAFMVRTASELHRAWHMTLLTSKILQQIKDKFNIRTTWELGVIKLKFRVEDGGRELHRKVPYDYDSEFQGMCTFFLVRSHTILLLSTGALILIYFDFTFAFFSFIKNQRFIRQDRRCTG